jgi:hypothetical protein
MEVEGRHPAAAAEVRRMIEDRDAIRDLAFAKAEQFEEERDAARRETREVREDAARRIAEAEARAADAEARIARWAEAAGMLRSACGIVLNHPLSKREDVQAALLTATQRYDTKAPEPGRGILD